MANKGVVQAREHLAASLEMLNTWRSSNSVYCSLWPGRDLSGGRPWRRVTVGIWLWRNLDHLQWWWVFRWASPPLSNEPLIPTMPKKAEYSNDGGSHYYGEKIEPGVAWMN